MKSKMIGVLTLLLSAALATSAMAQGGLIAYEPFNYADDLDINSTNGNGGAGWAGNWIQRGGNGGPERFTAQEVGLGYTDANGNSLVTAGNYGLADFNGFAPDNAGGGGNVQMYREVNFGNTGATTLDELVGVGNSYYISFIGQRRGATNTDAFLPNDPNYVNPHDPNEYSRNAHLSLTTSGGGEDGQLGNPSNYTTNTWKIRAKDTPDADTGVPFAYNQSFIVAKITVGDVVGMTSTDVIEMWVDPILTSEGAAGPPTATHFVLDGGNLYNLEQKGIGAYVGSQGGGRAGAVMAFDEIRIGYRWKDVTPYVPEPGSLTLLMLGGLSALTLRRRK